MILSGPGALSVTLAEADPPVLLERSRAGGGAAGAGRQIAETQPRGPALALTVTAGARWSCLTVVAARGPGAAGAGGRWPPPSATAGGSAEAASDGSGGSRLGLPRHVAARLNAAGQPRDRPGRLGRTPPVSLAAGPARSVHRVASQSAPLSAIGQSPRQGPAGRGRGDARIGVPRARPWRSICWAISNRDGRPGRQKRETDLYAALRAFLCARPRHRAALGLGLRPACPVWPRRSRRRPRPPIPSMRSSPAANWSAA